VFKCRAAYLLLMRAHVSPPSLTFFLNSSLGGFGSKIISDDGASMLHVEEVGCQGTLGGVGVNGSLLALLLLLNRRSKLRNWHNELLSGMLKVCKKVVLGAFCGGLAQEKVSLTDIVGSERSQKLHNSGQAIDSLEEGRLARLSLS
jgi:hypothetical protein